MASTIIQIKQGGTGQTTANAAMNALLPAKTGNSLKVLRVNATETDYEVATITSGSGLSYAEVMRLKTIMNNI